ncbi:MAG TPA: hypothetical protein VM580_29490 [Labilithrix sp.]|nr:hypothetical protein [Labilithrix sp.]
MLLEAGEDRGSSTAYQVPAFHPQATEDGEMRWDFYVDHYPDPQRAALDSKLTWETPSGELHVGPNPPVGSKQKGSSAE